VRSRNQFGLDSSLGHILQALVKSPLMNQNSALAKDCHIFGNGVHVAGIPTAGIFRSAQIPVPVDKKSVTHDLGFNNLKKELGTKSEIEP
jgi:hypothetical protein